MKTLFNSIWVFSFGLLLQSQQTYPVNGVHDERHTVFAFTNATIQISPSARIEGAGMLVKDGRIIGIGSGIAIPKEALVRDCKGQFIYASFIDLYAGLGAEQAKTGQRPDHSKTGSKELAGNWNPAIHPEFETKLILPVEEPKRNDWLASGIGYANIHHRDGIMRGSSKLIAIGEQKPQLAIIDPQAVSHFSFAKGSSSEPYPSSFVGAVALIRQTLYDAQWYASAKQKEYSPSLDALSGIANSTNIFELNHSLSIVNVKSIEQEFGLKLVMKGTGMEYMMMDELDGTETMIIPLNFPKAFEVNDPYLARMVSLREMKHWEAAPFNPYFLQKAGVKLCISRDTIKTAADFISNLQKAMQCGLKLEVAISALTTEPARILGMEADLGTLEIGKRASFFISNKPLDENGFQVMEHWSNGALAYLKKANSLELRGTYNLVIDKAEYELIVDPSAEQTISASAISKVDQQKLKVSIETSGNDLLTIIIKSTDSTNQLLYRLSGKISLNGGIWDGRGQDAQGQWLDWAAIRSKTNAAKAESKTTDNDSISPPNYQMPNRAQVASSSGEFVITNATVWTAADAGILKNADIYIVGGKIKAVGENMLIPTDVKRINANGKHITPGLIDEHSHIALRGGVNEGAQSVSSEVRMSDAIDPWNINIYRQLAGGVTSAQLLHGSANPIGGQSAIIKLKWGAKAGDMLIADAPGFIKFALGENVKRSNSSKNDRFPNTRMGVEQTISEAFVRARAYDGKTNKPQPLQKRGKVESSTSEMVRKDLELEVIAEIINEERFITCHSYVQSEILMLMDLADSLDFKVNTFTHILEGYKVADEMKANEVHASTFSDWWAYKFEVNDAIPYNAALLTKMGINTAINSDDAEMGRRLNQEAAKTMKYGNLSESDAIKLITANPAKMLHIDHRTGSIEVGKDADLVIWSDNPLSVFAHPEKTMIEGEIYFDISQQDRINKETDAERARIIALMINSKEKGKRKHPGAAKKEYHCDTETEDYINE